MSRNRLDDIVEAVLYEGFILYPYRPSAKKNRQRFTFGLVYPQAYSVAEQGRERYFLQTECLATRKEHAELQVSVRFLHPMRREVGLLSNPLAYAHGKPIEQLLVRIVPELRVEDKVYQSWQEATERRIQLPPLDLNRLETGGASMQFAFGSSVATEVIRNSHEDIKALLIRRQEGVEGTIEVLAKPLDSDAVKITVRVLNQTRLSATEVGQPETVLMRTLASAHTILQAVGTEFCSLVDPPPTYKASAAGCVNVGTWPVLVGDEQLGQRDTLLSSPIILYDYPQIAPESPGTFFDGTEVDELLALRIQTLTPDEKLEMREAGEHARQLLERTESLSQKDFLNLHGTRRDTALMPEDLFGASSQLNGVNIQGIYVRAGDRVRLRPKKRADVLDLVLNGKTAVVEALEQDVEDHIHVSVILENDPGKDLGLLRQPGHRFFYDVDELEPLGPTEQIASNGNGGPR